MQGVENIKKNILMKHAKNPCMEVDEPIDSEVEFPLDEEND